MLRPISFSARSAPTPAKLAALGIALTAFACGGTEDTERPTREVSDHVVLDPEDCEAASELYDFLVLEPFSDPQVQDSDTRILGWYVSYDQTNDEPTRNFSPIPDGQIETSRGGAPSLGETERCQETNRAMRLQSDPPGFDGWGMSFGSNMHQHTDSTEWGADGIAFWAKRSADTKPTQALRVAVPDEYTATNLGGTNCVDGLYDTGSCDAFGRGVGLTEDWRLHLIRFDEMVQDGFGKESPLDTPKLDALGGVEFVIGWGVWQVWIDEIAYFKRK